jgi:hypothetical protein
MDKQPIDIKKIIRDSRETLLNPKSYFSTLPLAGGFVEPVIKAAIYGAVAGLFALLWSVTGLSVAGGGLMGGAAGFMALVWSLIGAIAGLFIGGALMLLVSAICGGNTDYEANVRVTVSLMVVYPINAFLGFLYGINLTLGSLAGLIVSLYSIYLLYMAAIHALKGKESNVKIVAIVLLVLALIGAFGSRRATKKFKDFSDMYKEEQVD